MSSAPSSQTPPDTTLNRRRFISLAGCGAVTLALPALARAAGGGKLRFGVISDLHCDVMHDAVARITAFLEAMRQAKPAFIVHLGDFSQPKPANLPFRGAWNRYDGPRYHVLGNHDMDGGFTREQVVAWLEMPARHYAFEQGGVRFLVLDGNEPGGKTTGYARFIAAAQRDWLEQQLESTRLPVVVLIHQPLESPNGIVNQEEIRAILEKPRDADHPGVATVFSGHFHQDYVVRIGGIAHVQINSASYVWLGSDRRAKVYDDATHTAFPVLDRVAPYHDPLWALVTLDLDAGTLTIQGRRSKWDGPDPWQRGAPESDYPRAK